MQAADALPRRLLPFAVFFGALTFFVTNLPSRLYGDDVWFVRCILEEEPFTSHFLFMPLARGLTALGADFGIDPFTTLRWFAATGAALGGALLCAAACRLVAGTLAPLLFALLPLTAVSTTFFATAAEVHAVHLGALGALAWTLSRLRSRTHAPAVFLVGLAFGVFVGTHQSGALLLPGTVAFYFVATPGRVASSRLRDAAAFALAGAASVTAMIFFHWLESGRFTAIGDTTDLLGPGLALRASELGWRDLLGYLSIDGAAHAFPLFVAGFGALGVLLRTRTSLALAALVALLPYLLFFPLFHFPELGAYFIVCLPILVGLLFVCIEGDRVAGSACLAMTLVAACVVAPWQPTEIQDTLGSLWPAGLVGIALLMGVLFPRPVLSRATTLWAMGGMLLLQLVGGLRTLKEFDEEQPLLSWTHAACEATAGRDTLLITCGFQEYWLLVLLSARWPERYQGTWDFADSLPHPTPRPFLYGDPTVPREQFETGLATFLRDGTDVLLDERVVKFVEERSPEERALIGADLDHIRGNYQLSPFANEPFRAQRIQSAP